MTIFGQELPHVGAGGKGAYSLHIFSEETDDGFEHGADSPCGVPFFRMVLRDGEADFGVGLKPSIFVHKDDIRRFEWILIGQEDLTVVYSFMKVAVFWTLKSEVPCVEIIL